MMIVKEIINDLLSKIKITFYTQNFKTLLGEHTILRYF